MTIADLKNKKIHIIGISGSEGSSILAFLLKHNINSVTGHDFIERDELENNFKIWHKGISPVEKEKLWQSFSHQIGTIPLHLGKDYLKDVDQADIIFTPQSWRLYKENQKLLKLQLQKQPLFYSLTRMYLDLSPAKIVAVTGTVGKGSVASILVQLLQHSLRKNQKVYFAGNETWMPQLADKLDEMTTEDFLVLEISHRQLQDGISRGPDIAVFTNLYPNHLDELSWQEYKDVKLSLFRAQKKDAISILNYEIKDLREAAKTLPAKVVFFSDKNKSVNTINVQKIYDHVMNIKSVHYQINLLAAVTAADAIGIAVSDTKKYLPLLTSLPARLEFLANISGINFYDDIKSTTPIATIAAIDKLGPDTLVIIGGDTKNINYNGFFQDLTKKVKYIVMLKSELSIIGRDVLPKSVYTIVDSLSDALRIAVSKTEVNDNVLVSPAAAFFYSKFIKKQFSLRKILTSLPQGGQV